MIYAFADCELDTERLEVRRRGERRPVEPQVFDVLVHLVRHRDRIVTRDELLARVWGHAYVSDATVNSRLMAARKAIGDDGASQSLIRTVRGRGYRFVGEVAEAAESDRPAAAALPATPAPAVPAIGRGRELAELDRLLEAVLAGQRRLVVVTGAAGVGKTTLVKAFMAEAARRPGVVVAVGRCAEPHGPVEPYQPLLEAVGSLGRGAAADRLLETLSRRAPTWLLQVPWLASPDALDGARLRSLGAGRERMLREMVDALETLSATAPLLLLIDDLQWADEATVSLLAHLARRDEPARIMALATARPAPGRPSERLVGDLAPRGRCAEVALSGWSPGALAEYLGQRHPGLGERQDVAELAHRRTGGNPLFVECLLRWWEERGMIAEEGGRWRSEAGLKESPSQVPDTLRALIEQQIGALADGQQRVLEAASVAGAEFSAAAAASGVELETEDVEEMCMALARQGILRERPPADWPDGTIAAAFAFAHDIYREVLYDGLAAARRARLHRQIGARLERAHAGAPAEPSAELAGHFVRGGLPSPAVRYLRRSAQRAIARGAPEEAIRDVRRALALLERHPDVPRDDGIELWFHAALAGALVSVAGFASIDAERAIVRALEIARERADPVSAATFLQGLAGLHEYRGDHETSEALAAEALRAGSEAGELAVEAHDLIACSLFHQGRFTAALEQAERALSRHEHAHDHPVLATLGEHPAVSSHGWAGLSLWCMGEPNPARDRIDTALELAAEPTRRYSRSYARLLAARFDHMRGAPADALRHAEAGLDLADEHGFSYHAAVGQIFLGWARALEGDGEGIDLIHVGLGGHRATGAAIDRPYFLALLAEAWWAAGQPDRALGAVGEAFEMLDGSRAYFWEPELYRLRGALTREMYGPERATEAESDVRAALEVARRQGASALERRAAAALLQLTAG